MAHGHDPREIDGYERTTVVERPRQGFVAWLRRRCGFLADPEAVERIETEYVDGMALRDLMLLERYDRGAAYRNLGVRNS